MVVHVDTREPSELRGTKHKYAGGSLGLIQKALGEDQVIVRKLDSADYAFFDKDGHSLGIERKGGVDFIASLSGGRHRQANGNTRIMNQLDRLKEDYTHRALLLESALEFLPTTDNSAPTWGVSGWSWLSLQMMIWSWEQDGLKLFWIPADHEVAGVNLHRPLIELLRGLNNRANAGCILDGLRHKIKLPGQASSEKK